MARAKKVEPKKIFVLDTNIMIYDPYSLFRFKDNDIYIPMSELEELDANKKGITEVARNCRQASRFLDEIISFGPVDGNIINGFELKKANGGGATGRLLLQTGRVDAVLPVELPNHKVDNDILKNVFFLSEKHKDRDVVLVSKDINLRIKAIAMGLKAEDYYNDMVVEDSDLLHTGYYELPPKFWDKDYIQKTWTEHGRHYYTVKGSPFKKMMLNQFVCNEEENFCAKVIAKEYDTITFETTKDYSNKENVWGISAKSKEQNFAFNLLLNPDIPLVTILGQAGSGKTILSLAASLHMIYDKKMYDEIIFTRATISVGEDIGFLPGTEEEKMLPWMGALEDNLDTLINLGDGHGEKGKITSTFLKSKIKVKAINFMRGRTFLNKIVIIDEAQNLTPKQMKTLITRAGPGSKIICLGNIAQIDAPYLNEYNCGISYLVEKMKGWEGHGHITMMKVERSKLAEYAAQVL